ncbi:hypothetical protein [Candidatus Marithrix sp. Canyon 246]|nr:hypothetical protein [Candidatus Marithrix sp. Canyon 246]
MNFQISNLLAATESYNWNNLIQPINELNDNLRKTHNLNYPKNVLS